MWSVLMHKKPNKSRHGLAWSFILLLAFCHPTLTQAWGKTGHQVIGNLAWRLVNENVRTKITTILNGNHYKGSCTLQNCSALALVADWADVVRFTKAYHWSTPLHFIDIRDDLIDGGCPVVASASKNITSPNPSRLCQYDSDRDCPENFCAAGAIVNYTKQIETVRSSFEQQPREALMFLTHFIGDVHQPLHSSRKSDRGGNTIHVSAWKEASVVGLIKTKHRARHLRGKRLQQSHQVVLEQTNLHAVWDDGFIDRYTKENGGGLEEHLWDLIETCRQGNASKWNMWTKCANGLYSNCTSDWAQDSWEHAIQWAYRNTNGNEINSGDVLSDIYYTTRLQVVLERLAIAGVRLAFTLANNI